MGDSEEVCKQQADTTSNNEELWQLECRHWFQQNQHLLESKCLADCSFIVGKEPNSKKFGCHKLLLAKASSVFEAMLYRPINEIEVEDIEINDITPQVFQIMLEFLYVNTYSNLDFDKAMQLAYVTEKYMLRALQSLVMNNLILEMRRDNVITLYEFCESIDNYNFHKLKQRAWKMILECTDEIIAAESFLDAKKSTVLSIVEQDSLHITDESELIVACDKWAQRQAGATQDTKLLRAALGGIFQYLRFLNLSLKNFDSICKKINIITEHEKSQIRNSISKNLTETFKSANICLDVTKRIIFQLVPPEFKVLNSVTNYDDTHKFYRGYIHSIDFYVTCDVALTTIVIQSKNPYSTSQFTSIFNVTVRDENGKYVYNEKQYFLIHKLSYKYISIAYSFENPILLNRLLNYNILLTNTNTYEVKSEKKNKSNPHDMIITVTSVVDTPEFTVKFEYSKIY